MIGAIQDQAVEYVTLAEPVLVAHEEEKAWVVKLREIASALDVPMASDLLGTLSAILEATKKLTGKEGADTEGETGDAASSAMATRGSGAPDRRSMVILDARRAFKRDEGLQRTTSVQNYTNLALRDGNFSPMTESERLELSTVGV